MDYRNEKRKDAAKRRVGPRRRASCTSSSAADSDLQGAISCAARCALRERAALADRTAGAERKKKRGGSESPARFRATAARKRRRAAAGGPGPARLRGTPTR